MGFASRLIDKFSELVSFLELSSFQKWIEYWAINICHRQHAKWTFTTDYIEMH
ncbi:Unknown protein sequence [Pseudomonas syringae pv. cilantro]|uniref:Uncharacterized protein n=1 Tax=Pseudomonas syringae pv. cilantro TaxID=81035 RepID=A0A0N1JNP2_PSESX|nr:Unknown protein sequence [Pseudomonas syringae pv. cilantro]